MEGVSDWRPQRTRGRQWHNKRSSVRLRPLSGQPISSQSVAVRLEKSFCNSDDLTGSWIETNREKAINLLSSSTVHHVTSITEIDLHGQHIEQIEQLTTMSELKVLDLSCNSIKKIENLENNRTIQELKLYGNNISVVENLERLKELHNLQLQHNQIASLGKSLKLTNLRSLRVDHNVLTELKTSQLSGCPNIRFLNVSNNSLKELQAVKVLLKLEELLASGNQLLQAPDVSICRYLREIDLSENRLTDLSGLRSAQSLQVLIMSGNHLTDIKSAGRHISLTELQISSNQLSNTSPVCLQFPNLEVLNMASNQIRSWTELVKLKDLLHLVELEVKCNPFVASNRSYHTDFIDVIPSLQRLDGLSVKAKKQNGSTSSETRLMSASVGSNVKNIDTQLQNLDLNPEALNDITERFTEIRRSVAQSLSPPSNGPQTIETPNSAPPYRTTCNSRVRIKEAQNYAAINF